MKITTNRQETSPNGNRSSVYSHVMVANSVQTAALGLSAALYVLNSCPIHSRYLRHGIGKREVFQVGQFLVNNTEQVRTFTVLDRCLQNTTFVLDESSAFPFAIFHHQFFSQMISFFTVFVILILIKMSTSNNSFA